MTLRSWAAIAALPVLCMGCSSDDGTPPAASGGQTSMGGSTSPGGATGTGGSSGGSTASAGSGGASGGSGGQAMGGSAGSGGIGGSGGATGGPVMPTEAGGLYTFSYGDVVFEVDAMVAGRITTFSKGGTNVLDDGDGINYYGSTLWLAPEADYELSPEGIDAGVFTATLDGASLVLTGPLDSPWGYSAVKRFTVDSALDRVEIVYTLKNETAANPVAAWEVTRLAHDGISFYAAPTVGTDAEWGAVTHTYDAVGLATWVDHAGGGQTELGKLFQDGEGWSAHAQGSLLFLKTFPDLNPATEFPTPDTEVEVFVDPVLGYIELENAGPITTLAAGASLTYTVNWYLRSIPGTVTVAPQSQTLFDFAAGIAQ